MQNAVSGQARAPTAESRATMSHVLHIAGTPCA
jgi:hypothetical protein